MKVKAANENIQKYIIHPVRRVKFRSDGTADWPMDQFTMRRIRDGDVTVVEQKKPVPAPKTRSSTSTSSS